MDDRTGLEFVKMLLTEQSKEQEEKDQLTSDAPQLDADETKDSKPWLRGKVLAVHSDFSYDVRLERKDNREMVLTYIKKEAVRVAGEESTSSKSKTALYDFGNEVYVWPTW